MSAVGVEALGDANVRIEPVRRRPFRLLARSPSVWVFVLLLIVAIFGQLLAPYGGTQILGNAELQAPSVHHLFGTDSNSMDVLSRVLYGARPDLLLALASAAIAATVGSMLGLLAGFAGGWLDPVLQRVNEVILAFPVLVFAMAVLVAIGTTLPNLTVVIAFVNIPVYFRIVRSIVLPMRHAEFVDAARIAGNRTSSILLRHLAPNLWAPVMAQFTVNFAWAIQLLAGLSFLGLGVHVPDPEWGSMVQQGAPFVIAGQWWVSFFPGLAIFAAVLALTRIGVLIERIARIS